MALNTGLDFIDGILGDIDEGSVVGVAGAPGGGKTKLLMEFAFGYLNQGIPVNWVTPTDRSARDDLTSLGRFMANCGYESRVFENLFVESQEGFPRRPVDPDSVTIFEDVNLRGGGPQPLDAGLIDDIFSISRRSRAVLFSYDIPPFRRDRPRAAPLDETMDVVLGSTPRPILDRMDYTLGIARRNNGNYGGFVGPITAVVCNGWIRGSQIISLPNRSSANPEPSANVFGSHLAPITPFIFDPVSNPAAPGTRIQATIQKNREIDPAKAAQAELDPAFVRQLEMAALREVVGEVEPDLAIMQDLLDISNGDF
jgi:hypothetical protein